MKILLLLLLALAPAIAPAQSPNLPFPPAPPPPVTVRFATYNTSLFDDRDGGLVRRLEYQDPQAAKIAAVIQHERPDVLLLNEFDYDAAGRAADLFQTQYLERSQSGEAPIRYPYRYLAPVNTGVASGMDLNRDGRIGGEGRDYGEDAFGYGLHPGQYGMLVLSRYPIDVTAVRTFQKFLWKDLPDAVSPRMPGGDAPWYPDPVWARLRLSSKSHWDVPVRTPLGLVHFLVHHPTPPVFDGAEDRNGARNFDEIRFWAEYLRPGPKPWLCDDQGRCGGLDPAAAFVVAGDHNADPEDGASRPGAMQQLLEHPRVLRYPAPRSEGAVLAAAKYPDIAATRRTPAATDTGDFGPRTGCLRLDYLLPSTGFQVTASAVFWPKPGEPGADWIQASDHHLVWVDLASGQ